MQVCSTRDTSIRLSFRDSLIAGLPPGGGLYQPSPPPDLRSEIASLSDQASFLEVSTILISALFKEEFAAIDRQSATATGLAQTAFPFAPSLSWLHDDIALLELFHGPTHAFKDFGASFLAALLECFAGDVKSSPIKVLVATSGDTGSAVARAFWRRAGIEVVVLYPSGRISLLQEQQLTTLGDNIYPLEVKGTFDDCQYMVKAALADSDLMALTRLCPANSISLGRLLPQAFYYIFAGLRLRYRGQPLFCVPSGNFGNLTAGIYAARWGLPVAGFLAATNLNDVVPRFLESGEWLPRSSAVSLSNAMDVGNPSNFERILAHWDRNPSAIRSHLRGLAVSDKEILGTMRCVYQEDGRLVDPHTAVGIAAARRFCATDRDRSPVVVLATADACKFPEIVRRATGVKPAIPESLQDLMDKPKQATRIEPHYEALRDFILKKSV